MVQRLKLSVIGEILKPSIKNGNEILFGMKQNVDETFVGAVGNNEMSKRVFLHIHCTW